MLPGRGQWAILSFFHGLHFVSPMAINIQGLQPLLIEVWVIPPSQIGFFVLGSYLLLYFFKLQPSDFKLLRLF
jgi:hypothetical protein